MTANDTSTAAAVLCPPCLPTLSQCYRPVEQYHRLIEVAQGKRLTPRSALQAVDAFVMHQIAAAYPVAPAVIDAAAAATGGDSAMFWWGHADIAALIVLEKEMPQCGSSSLKALLSSAAEALRLDRGAATFADAGASTDMEALQGLLPPLAPPFFCLAGAAEDADSVRALLWQIFASFPDPVVMCWPLGRIGDDGLLDLCCDFSRTSACRITAVRELNPVLASSQLALICREENAYLACTLERIAGLFEGNLQFLTMAGALAESAIKIQSLEEALARESRRQGTAGYAGLVQTVRQTVKQAVPAGSTVLVISKGDDDLLDLGSCVGWHFPQTDEGVYSGHHPADSAAAVRELERLRNRGAEYLVIPKSASWWLDFYDEFAQYLDERHRRIVDDSDMGVIYALQRAAEPESAQDARSVRVVDRREALSSHNGHRRLFSENGARRPAEETCSPENSSGASWKSADSSGNCLARLIAFYLPQFHPIPENDRWWGPGFTEWTNVAKARPLFDGHDQPHLPGELGFYDLRLAEARAAQAELAREHGIHGFCYYHYWFGGKRLLELPFNEVLRTGEPDFPFCLCWANEPWSRRWDGGNRDVLQPQSYSKADDLAHIRWLLDALADPRAICIDGKPVFLVYRTQDLPDRARTADLWRQEVERAGLPGLYLIAVETAWDTGRDVVQDGFDAKVLFQPQFGVLGKLNRMNVHGSSVRAYDYQEVWRLLAEPQPVAYTRYETVFPSWDNTPRTGDQGRVIHNSTPAAYRQWLRLAIERTLDRSEDERVVFINAWNEWAEGCHLEPDKKHGRAYLEATRQAVMAASVR